MKGLALSLSSTTRVAVTVEAMPAVPVPVTGMTVSEDGVAAVVVTVSVAATGEDEPAGMLVGEMVATTPVGRLPPRVSVMGPVYPLRRDTDTANVAVEPGATVTDAGVTPTAMPGDDGWRRRW